MIDPSTNKPPFPSLGALCLALLCALCLLLGPQRAWSEEDATAASPVPHNGAPAPSAADQEAEDGAEAATETEVGEVGEEDEPLLERAMGAVDNRHEQLSDRLLASALWLDSFFASERLEVETQKTRFIIGFSLFAEDSQGVRFDLATRFRLSLPLLSERFQLVFSGDPDDELGTDTVAREELARRLREQSEQTVTVGIRYLFRHTLLKHASLRAGVRMRSGTPVLMLEPRYRQDVPLPSHWLFRFTQRFIGYTNDTYEVRTVLDLERPLAEISEAFFFRAAAEGHWLSEEAGYLHALHLNLYQTLSPRRVLSYRVSNYFQTRPNHRRESTVLTVLYRQMLGRDWLYAEMAPHLAFPRERNFQPTLGGRLNVGVIFGAY